MIWLMLANCVVLAFAQVVTSHRLSELKHRVRYLEEDMPLPDKWQAPDIDTESDDVP